MSNDSETRATIWMTQELKDRIQKEEVDGTTSLSEWMRRAARDRLAIEELCEGSNVELPDGDREREAVLADLLSDE